MSDPDPAINSAASVKNTQKGDSDRSTISEPTHSDCTNNTPIESSHVTDGDVAVASTQVAAVNQEGPDSAVNINQDAIAKADLDWLNSYDNFNQAGKMLIFCTPWWSVWKAALPEHNKK